MSKTSAFRAYWRRFNWPIPLAMVALLVLSVQAVGVAERADGRMTGFTTRQAIFGAVAVAGFFGATLVPYTRIGRWSYALLAGTIALLLVVFAFPGRRGSHRWIHLPGLSQVTLQPSELAKLTFIIALAWYLRYRDSYRRLAGLIVPFAITLLPLGLILMEPDLGTALLLLPTLMVMLFVAGAKWRHLAVIVALAAAVVLWPVPRRVAAKVFANQRPRLTATAVGPVTFYHVDDSLSWSRRPVVPVSYCRVQIGGGGVYDLRPLSLCVMDWTGHSHQSRRIEGWLRQDDPRIRANMGYQQYHSMMILGAGRLAGRDAPAAGGEPFQMLPDDHTDFIFSVIGGQWGFIGCAGVLALYAIIFIFGADVAATTKDPFGRLLAVGVLALLAAQMFINIGMTMGLMPITGMTLPLVSYGGSSLLVNGMALGLLVNVARHRPVLLSRRPFEFDGEGP